MHPDVYLLAFFALRFLISLHWTHSIKRVRKNSLARLVSNLSLLVSLLLDITHRHSSNSLLNLERLAATALALLCRLSKTGILVKYTSAFLLLRLQAVVHRIRAGFFFWEPREQHLWLRKCTGWRWGKVSENYLSVLADVHASVSGINLVLRERAG